MPGAHGGLTARFVVRSGVGRVVAWVDSGDALGGETSRNPRPRDRVCFARVRVGARAGRWMGGSSGDVSELVAARATT